MSDFGEGVNIEPPSTAATSAPRVSPPDPARRAFLVLSVVAPVALAAAVLANWLWAPLSGPSGAGAADDLTVGAGVVATETVELEKPAVDLIPERVLQYETISHQAIPGLEDRGGEAVYKTLNMNIEARIEIVVYARTEGFGSALEAKTRLDQLMSPYSANRSNVTLNGATPAISGEAPDGGAYAVGWLRGNYATMVKASFAEWTPKDQVPLIKQQGDHIVDAVDVFQRTGREGVQK